jgi:hypothetical protein
MRWLNEYDVILDAILLKPNMILPGLDAPIETKERVRDSYRLVVLEPGCPSWSWVA